MGRNCFCHFLLSWVGTILLFGSSAAQPADPQSTSRAQNELWVVALSNGDRILGQMRPPKPREFELKTYFGDVAILRTWVRSVAVFRGALPADRVGERDEDYDTLHFRSGEVVRGRLKSIAKGKLEFVLDQRSLRIEWDDIEAIVFRAGKEPSKPEKNGQQFPIARVRLVDGSLITGEILQLSKQSARVRLPYLAHEQKISLGCIVSVSPVGERCRRPKGGYEMPETAQPASPVYKTHLGFVRGHVTTDKGVALTGCYVFFYELAEKKFYGEDNFSRFVTHTASGWYVSPPLKPGRYAVLARYSSGQDPAGAFWIGWAPEVPVQGGKTAVADLAVLSIEDRWPGFMRQLIEPNGVALETVLRRAIKVVPPAEHQLHEAFVRAASVYQRLYQTIDPEQW